MALTATVVQVKCVSKKQKNNYNEELPISHEIELEVPYDQQSIFWKMSGGTNITLNTVNQAAADMFIIGKTFEINISPVA